MCCCTSPQEHTALCCRKCLPTFHNVANCNCIVLCCMNSSHQKCAANTACVNVDSACMPLTFCNKLTSSFNDHVSLQSCALVQVGKYKPAQRAAVVAYRGAQFFGVSFVASMVGHSLTKYMVSLSSVFSLGTVVLYGMLGTTMAVVRFVHRAT